MKDIEIQVRLFNNRLRELARQAKANQITITALCKDIGITVQDWYAFASLRKSPLKKLRGQHSDPAGGHSAWRKPALKIAEYFGVLPDELWPESTRKLREREKSFFYDAHELGSLSAATPLAYLPDDPVEEHELQRDVREALSCLTPRERLVIEMRFGLGEYEGQYHLLEDVGHALDVTRERVRQIEAKAFRKFRAPFNHELRRRLHEHLEDS
jgi:RNA polymerase sigma factor (sigma-70 family)